MNENYYNMAFAECPERLRSALMNCGHERSRHHSYYWDGLKRGGREMAIWQYTLAGEGALRFGSDCYAVLPGYAMVLVVPEEHCYYLPEHSASWEYLFVTVYGAEAVRLVHEYRRRHGFLCGFAPDSRAVETAWRLLSNCRRGRIADAYAASAAAYGFIMDMCASAQSGESGNGGNLVHQIERFCLDNIGRPISVEELAKLAGCSRWHFSRLFREASGYAPRDFVIELRMRKAMGLLQTGRETVKEIAFLCGFESPGYFCKVFRRMYGVSPGGFRRGESGNAAVGGK